MKLHHRVNARQVSDTIVVNYSVTPIEIRRPDLGSSVIDVRCGACDGVIQLRVHSIQRTKRARRRWLGMVVLALLVVAAGTYLHFESANYGYSLTLAFAAVMAYILGLAATVFWSLRWFQEDGVRIVSKAVPGASHELIPLVR
ncbi:hypothetical protein [Actinomadura sp. 6N118]|uniref:hypothetical protein n=1 Tax=Actinomadura sp. 6N118 TaxID=3375151 RepID=UPI00379E1C6A